MSSSPTDNMSVINKADVYFLMGFYRLWGVCSEENVNRHPHRVSFASKFVSVETKVLDFLSLLFYDQTGETLR